LVSFWFKEEAGRRNRDDAPMARIEVVSVEPFALDERLYGVGKRDLRGRFKVKGILKGLIAQKKKEKDL
jgi:hypothetical protein